MYSQTETAATIDTFLLLAGEGQEYDRTKHTNTLYNTTPHQPPILISGSHSGLYKPPLEPEAQIIRNILLAWEISKEKLFTEEKSIDTIGNMVFSRPILDQILSGSNTKRIGLITDKYHMQRALWIAQKVFPSNYTVDPLPTEKTTSTFGSLVESLVLAAWKHDFRKFNPGYQEQWEEYMNNNHPMHNPDAPFSAYKLGIQGLNLISRSKTA